MQAGRCAYRLTIRAGVLGLVRIMQGVQPTYTVLPPRWCWGWCNSTAGSSRLLPEVPRENLKCRGALPPPRARGAEERTQGTAISNPWAKPSRERVPGAARWRIPQKNLESPHSPGFGRRPGGLAGGPATREPLSPHPGGAHPDSIALPISEPGRRGPGRGVRTNPRASLHETQAHAQLLGLSRVLGLHGGHLDAELVEKPELPLHRGLQQLAVALQLPQVRVVQ